MRNIEESPVVAGIIDIENNEIIEVTRKLSEKMDMLIRVRDELVTDKRNPDFTAFDVSCAIGGDLAYIRDKHLKNASENLLLKLELYQAEYRLSQAGKSLAKAKAELDIAEETASEALKAIGTDPKKRAFLSNALEAELEALQEVVDDCTANRNTNARWANKLDARIAELADDVAETATSPSPG